MLKELDFNIDSSKIKYSLTVKNLKTQEVFNINENKKVSSASTIKILIMAEIMNQVEKGVLSLKQRIKVRAEDRIEYSILSMLDDENTYSLRDVVTLMIVQSDNTATNILIDIAGMDNINTFINQIGLNNTILQRRMLDFTAKQAGRDNLTSAGDMAIFLELLYNGKIVNNYYSTLMLDILRLQLDRTMMYMNIPDNVVIAHKSGELDFLDHEVGIIYAEKGDFIFSMLTWEAESNNFARKTVGNVSKIVYDYFAN